MSFGTDTFCSVCAVIDFQKLFYHEWNESILGYKDLCLGTLEQVLERAENCNICKLVIDVYKERFRRAPHGRSLDIYNRDSLYPIPSRCINELHEEVKKYGLRLTENGRPIRCNLREITFARTNIQQTNEDENGSDNDAPVEVSRAQLMLHPCPWTHMGIDSVTLQAIWPEGTPGTAKRPTTEGCISLSGTGRPIEPLLDFQLVRRWIYQCEKDHGDKCHKPDWLIDNDNEWLSTFRVIDVQQRQIIDLLPSMRYVALSYVWGSDGQKMKLHTERRLTRENLPQLQQSGGLDKIFLPQKIKDSMYVVEKVGERYLWVDALCIIQDDYKDVSRQTAHMDLIYSKALFTIIAGCGDDSESGLAGLPSQPRDFLQRQVKVSSRLHITPCAALSEDDVLQCSRWSTRGWTYQERCLSRRTLIFTESQVYWQCESTTYDEETILDIPGTLVDVASIYLGCNDMRDIGDTKFSKRSLSKSIRQFSERKLTYPADALPAFSGLIRRWEHVNKEKLYWGLRTKKFDQALIWKWGNDRRREVYRTVSGGSVIRRVSYPSWSWLGWVGYVIPSPDLEDHDNDRVVPDSILAFYSLISDGSISPIHTGFDSSSSNLFNFTTPKWKGEITEYGPIDMSNILLASELEPLEMAHDPYDTGRIVFWTSHTETLIRLESNSAIHIQTPEGFLKIEADIPEMVGRTMILHDPEETLGGGEEGGFGTINETDDGARDDSCVDDVSGELSAIPPPPRSTVGLIVISRQFLFDVHQDTGHLNVMIVEERVRGSGVWSRLGLCVIREEDWLKLELNWRLIILE
ncbi:hypothetical protein FOVSG1_012042 [Fusarium oxysporum f. sp. vasinfectum]